MKKLFGFDTATMSVKKEIIGGITTFLTMAYILAVNPTTLSNAGMDKGAVFTATILSAVIATLLMSLFAKLPFALASGMGLNAFFAYTVVLTMGYSWQFALTAVLIEGLLFLLLTVTGMRKIILDAIPLTLRKAIAPGIGLFITFIGLKNAGIIAANDATLVTLGNLHDPAVLLAIFGVLLSSVLLICNVTGALLFGIIITAVVGIPLGVSSFSEIVAVPPSIKPVLFKLDFSNVFSMDMLICVMTFLFVDMFDTFGAIFGIASRGGLIDEKGNVKNMDRAFISDAVGTAVGSLLGTSTVSTYVESAAGVNAGGRSGLTAFVTAMCFILALFFAPLFLSVPAQATAPALILVGVMMMSGIQGIDFNNFIDAIPCFITIVLMPLTYSIADGIMMGVIAYVLLRVFSGKVREMTVSLVVLALLFILRYCFL